MMTLTDSWVRVNRARGLELVSPEDLLSAAKQLQQVPTLHSTATMDIQFFISIPQMSNVGYR